MKYRVNIVRTSNFQKIELEASEIEDRTIIDEITNKLNKKAEGFLKKIESNQEQTLPFTPKKEWNNAPAINKKQYDKRPRKPMVGAATLAQRKFLDNKQLSPEQMDKVNDPNNGKQHASDLIDFYMKNKGQDKRNYKINQSASINNPNKDFYG